MNWCTLPWQTAPAPSWNLPQCTSAPAHSRIPGWRYSLCGGPQPEPREFCRFQGGRTTIRPAKKWRKQFRWEGTRFPSSLVSYVESDFGKLWSNTAVYNLIPLNVWMGVLLIRVDSDVQLFNTWYPIRMNQIRRYNLSFLYLWVRHAWYMIHMMMMIYEHDTHWCDSFRWWANIVGKDH